MLDIKAAHCAQESHGMSYPQNTKTLVYIFSLVVTGLWSEVYSTNAQVNYAFIVPGVTPTPSFAEVILATEPANLKGYWKCDETSGTTLADSSGNSKNLTITGAINANYWLGESRRAGHMLPNRWSSRLREQERRRNTEPG